MGKVKTDIKVYTLEEVAEILKLTYWTVYGYVSNGKLKATKIGKQWRVTDEDLKKFLS